MKKAIEETKKIIDSSLKYGITGVSKFDGYQRSYFWTNESISKYLNVITPDSDSCALTVLASGDHAYNLVALGLKDIDTFDINKLTEFIAFGLKKAMFLKYNYYEFLSIMSFLSGAYINLERFNEFINDLLPFMDAKYRLYWKEINDYIYKNHEIQTSNLNIFRFLTYNINIARSSFKDCNNYLKDEYSYNAFKSNLSKANINFKLADAYNLGNEFNRKYDFILLSNILDYADSKWGKFWSYDKLQEFEESLKGLCKPNTIVFLKYIFEYSYTKNDKIIMDSDIRIENLTDESIITLPNYYNFGIEDAMILKRFKE